MITIPTGDLTPAILERIFYKALAEGDAKGVEAALTVLALKDPHRAAMLYDHLEAALALRRAVDAARSEGSGHG